MTLAEVVAKIKYRPGWRISVIPGTHEYSGASMLAIDATVMCAYDNTKTIQLHSRRYVSLYLESDGTEAAMMRFCFSALRDLELHELGEFFQYGNERPFDPHK